MKQLFIVFVLIIILVGCNDEVGTFIATGKSNNWSAEVTYTVDPQMVNDRGILIYLGEHPPKEMEYEYIYPNGFTSGTAGKVQSTQSEKEWSLGGGGASRDTSDTIENLKARVDVASIKVVWIEDGKRVEEKIELGIKN